ncbi:MAG TPA: winged helix-turn-helix transcriptional regulator [Streptosporangiaceae bacterium]|jgi:DNA-binding HxlR family transcriptional regulator
MDWEDLLNRLAPLRRRWDLAVLANLASNDGPVRPADLIKAINAQSSDGQISWKVLEAGLRRLETSGYVGRQQVRHVPRETRYWLLPPGRQLITALTVLQNWYTEDPGTGG